MRRAVLWRGCALPLRHELFDHDAIILSGTPHAVTLTAPGERHAVTVSYPQMPYVGFWHEMKLDAPFVCVEPWAALPARDGRPTVLEEQADLLRLEPGGRYENNWSITVR